MKGLREKVVDNLPWIITTLLAIGAFGATIKYQGEAIASNDRADSVAHEKIYTIERTLVRLESMQEDIRTIKEDIKDIKKIVLKPAIACDDDPIPMPRSNTAVALFDRLGK